WRWVSGPRPSRCSRRRGADRACRVDSAPMLTLLAMAVLAASPPVSDGYEKEIETWRQAREARLRSDEGWLTVAGLFWLKEGENRLGSDPGAEVVLPAHSSPARAGILRVQKGKVTIEPAAGLPITLAGKPVGKTELRSDVPGPPDVLALGQLKFFVIERSGKLAIRLRDLQSAARRSFTGLHWFPIRKEYRVVGRFTPHPAPKKLTIPNVLGLV